MQEDILTCGIATDMAMNTIKNAPKLVGSIVKPIGKAAYWAAGTKPGKYALATGIGLFAARQIAKKFKDKEKDSPNKSRPKRKKLDWEKGRKPIGESSLLELNRNIPGFPVPKLLPTRTPAPKRNILSRNPRSISGYLQNKKTSNYRPTAERDFVEIQRKIGQKNVKIHLLNR